MTFSPDEPYEPDRSAPRRVVVAVLAPPVWTPPGVDPGAWREALAEDLLDVLATLAEVAAAVAVPVGDEGFASSVGWPGLPGYSVPAADVASVLAAVAGAGYDQAVLLAADAPDLPAMLIAKLLRPLTTRPVTVAPATDAAPGLFGLAARLPAVPWLPRLPLDQLDVGRLREAAPRPADVAVAPGWHRLRAPEDLRRLDPRLEGWEATRHLLDLGSRAGS